MSLGVRFKYCFAICALMQITSPTIGLKMQVSNLASSPKLLSASDLSPNSIPTSQITKSEKLLPNVPIQQLKSLTSPNTLEPMVNVPNSLTTPKLNYNGIPRNWQSFERIINPQENIIDAVFNKATPYIISATNSGVPATNLENVLDLLPSESHNIPSNSFANIFNKNMLNNNMPVNSNFAVVNSQVNGQNAQSSIDAVQAVNNANIFNNFNSAIPKFMGAFETLSNPKQNNALDVHMINNEGLQMIGSNNNIPSLQNSFGPTLNSNPNYPYIVRCNSNDNNLLQPNNGINIVNTYLKGPNYEGVQNIRTTDENLPYLNTNGVTVRQEAAEISAVNNFRPNSNIQIVSTSFENQQQNILSNGNLNNPSIGEAYLKTDTIANVFNNVNQINLQRNQIQFDGVSYQQPNSPKEQNLVTNNFIPPIANGLNIVTSQNISPKPSPLFENGMNQLKLIQNELNTPLNSNNFNDLFNIQGLSTINVNSQSFQNDNSAVIDINNNIIAEVQNDTPFVKEFSTSTFNPRFSTTVRVDNANNIPIRPNVNIQPDNQMLEITPAKIVQSSPSFVPVIQNNNILSEAPVTTLPSRNPFINLYKSQINKINNPVTQPDILSTLNEIETNVVSQPYRSPNSVDIQSSRLTQNLEISNNNLVVPPDIQVSSLVSSAPKFEAQASTKPSRPRFTPKITSVFNFASPKENEFRLPSSNPFSSSIGISPSSQIEHLNIPETELPSVSITSEFGLANSNFGNPYFNNVNLQKGPSEIVRPTTVSNFGASLGNTISVPQRPPSPSSEFSASQNSLLVPCFDDDVNKQSMLRSETEQMAKSNPGLLSSNSFQQSPNFGLYSSSPETPTPQIVPTNAYNNINQQALLNLAQPSINPVSQSSLGMSSIQTFQPNFLKVPPNNFAPLPQEQVYLSNNKIPVDAPSSITVFGPNNNIEPMGFAAYISPFNTVYNTLQSVPSYSNNVVNKIDQNNPNLLQDNLVTPLYFTEPQAILKENPYTPSAVPNLLSTQPNSNLPNPNYNLVSNENLNIPFFTKQSTKENIPLKDVPINAQQFLSIPEVTYNNVNLQNLSPRVAITKELPYLSQNNFKQYPSSDFLSPVSNLPNVYTPALQQIVPATQIPQTVYSNITPNTIFPQINDIFPTTGIVNSINDAATIIAKNALTNFINKKLNAKTKYAPVANLPPVNPYLPNSFYNTPNKAYDAVIPSSNPSSISYNSVIPYISALPSPNINSVSCPANSYEVYEIPSYYTDDYIPDLCATNFFIDIPDIPDVPEIPDVPDYDYEFENRLASFVPYMSSLKINVLPIIENVNLEALLPSSILVDAYPNNLSPSYPSTNIPYSLGPQIVDVQNVNGKKSRDAKEIERLIRLFILSELINGNDNTDWEGLDLIIRLLLVS